jgi:hypothetical protein
LDDVAVSNEEISFGSTPLLPGSVEEVEFSVVLNSKKGSENSNKLQGNISYILRIVVVCNNTEFDSLDEYVFSVRNNNEY